MAAGASLIVDGIGKIHGGPAVEPARLGPLAILDGALLILGLWTPIAGSVVIAIAAWAFLIRHDNLYPAILLAAMGAALALVGPGALSLDAWLFGWKRIDLER
jgi:uncharacterized membrane protein YphA (DoxX/SURF4 family)